MHQTCSHPSKDHILHTTVGKIEAVMCRDINQNCTVASSSPATRNATGAAKKIQANVAVPSCTQLGLSQQTLQEM